MPALAFRSRELASFHIRHGLNRCRVSTIDDVGKARAITGIEPLIETTRLFSLQASGDFLLEVHFTYARERSKTAGENSERTNPI
jgi:hypothetical protein